MIEAVNASISVAPSVRAVAQQVSVAESFSANPAQVQKVAVGNNYTSQYIRLAPDTKPIFVVRETSTGESIRQFPTESQLRAYQRAQNAQQAATKNAEFRTELQGTSDTKPATEIDSAGQVKEVRVEVKKSEAQPLAMPDQTSVEFQPEGDTGVEQKAPAKVSVDV
jgi:delta-aminolevulinic acid dehydratase/porphobilinogen synthase